MGLNYGTILKSIAQPQLRTDIPDFQVGDTVRVDVKVTEGTRTRIQAFEGTVIAINNGGIGKTFTVRKISFSEGVERVFPYNAPTLSKITVLERGRVRRAKLYYLRDRRGKSARLKSDRSRIMREAQKAQAQQEAANAE
ncbi:MAG: 50S ribosomal protein L19 [Deinococcaceae bacterium]